MTIITGKENLERYHAVCIKVACKMYAKSKIVANRRLTPTVLLQEAGKITGKTYKRGEHHQAALDIEAMLKQ